MSDKDENPFHPTGAVLDSSDACHKNMSDVNSTMEIDLSSKEMTQIHVKFFHKSSFFCPLCDTPNDEKSRPLVQFYEIDYLSLLQNKNLNFNRKSPKIVNRNEKSSSVTGQVRDGALNHNARLSGEINLQDAPSLKSSATEESSWSKANASVSQTSKALDIEVTGLVSQLPKENDSELNALVKSIPQNDSNGFIKSNDLHNKAWKESDDCIAKGSEDGQRYKSIITEVEDDKVNVISTDYGNSEKTNKELLKAPHTVLDENGEITVKNVKEKIIKSADEEKAHEEVKHWKENDKCVAQWLEDGCWYRSVIEKIESPDKVLVKFIDYGNSDYTSLSNLQPFETPIDVNGQIGENNPQTENNNQCEVQDELKVKQYRVVEGENKDGLNEGVAQWKEGDKCVAQWVEDGCWYRSIIEKIESPDQVLVTFIDYGNSDYTSLSKLKPCDTVIEEDGQIKDIEIKIQDKNNNEGSASNTAEDGPVEIGEAGDCIDRAETFWKEGDDCIAQWREDDLWYRSVVTKIESNDKVLVTFTDYGNSEYTSLEALKRADTKIHEDGTIGQVDDDGQLKAAAEANESGVDESEEKSLVKVNTKETILWKVGDKCLAKCSGDQGWYKSVVVLIEKDGKTLVKFIQNGNLDYTTLSDLKPMGTKISVSGQVESHDVSVGNDEKFLDTVAQDIPSTSDCFQMEKGTADSAGLTTNEVSSTWKVGDSCVAQWRLDGRWYKGMITKLKSSGKVKVLFIDYGNSDYTSIDLLKPFGTVIGEDGTLDGKNSSVVIPSKPVKLEPIAEEQLEDNGNEEQPKVSVEKDREFFEKQNLPSGQEFSENKFQDITERLIAQYNQEGESRKPFLIPLECPCCPIGDDGLKVRMQNPRQVFIHNRSEKHLKAMAIFNVDTIKEDNDKKDLVEFNNQEEMLVPNKKHNQNSVVAPTLHTSTPNQSTLMNTDTLLLESMKEINPPELVNEIEVETPTETTCESYQAVFDSESMSNSCDGESTTELLMINNAGKCNVNLPEKSSVNYDESNDSKSNENQTDGNSSFGLIEPLLKKSEAGDDQSDSAPELLTNNSESTFHGRVKNLAVHEEGAKYLVAITNQDTVVRIQAELVTDALPLMLHTDASKVMQAVIDVTQNIDEILQIVLENFSTLSSHKNGSKIIQKILTRLPTAQKSEIVAKLENEEVLSGLLSSQHGTNVAQACLLYLTEGCVTCVGNFLLGNIVELGSSPNGSYFIQLFMTSNNLNIVKVFKDKVLDAIVENADHLVKDKFGTWLAQTAAKVMKSPRHILLFSGWVKDNIKDVYCDPDAMHFASSVIEALVKISSCQETDFNVNSRRESAKILGEVIFLMTDTLVEVKGSFVPLIVAASIDPYGHVLAREVCLQARYVPEIRNKFIQVFSEYKSKLEDDTFGCLVLKGLGGLL